MEREETGMELRLHELNDGLAQHGYICDDTIATVLFMAERLGKPLLIEGPAGVGKTELAKAYSSFKGHTLVRLQCYEGLDETKAIYEWNYKKQLLYIQAEREAGDWKSIEGDIFTEQFLLARPLLQSITSPQPTVLLVDELDKVDQEFEAMLLELLGDWQITIPEIGTISARHIPVVFLTSNRSRELSEALKRRCLYLYMDYPTQQREREIVMKKFPDLDQTLASRVTQFVQRVRSLDLRKKPSIAETLDWVAAMLLADLGVLDQKAIELAASSLLKHNRDAEILMEKFKSGRWL
jgi:MoxR-like ATPase